MTIISSDRFTWTKNVGVAEASDNVFDVGYARVHGFKVESTRTQAVLEFTFQNELTDNEEELIGWVFAAGNIEIHILND